MQIWFDASSSFQWALLLTQSTAIFKTFLKFDDTIFQSSNLPKTSKLQALVQQTRRSK
jgi:hypothetical protein